MGIWQFKIVSISLIFAAVMITGCAGSGAVPDDHFYQLPEIIPPKSFTTPRTDVIIGVDSLRSDGLHGERAILYINADSPLEIRRYHYHYWTDSPPRTPVAERPSS